MGKSSRIVFEQEGVFRLDFGPRTRKGDVWLDDFDSEKCGSSTLADAVLSLPGDLQGKRVRISITVLEDLPNCARCGVPQLTCSHHTIVRLDTLMTEKK